MSKFKIGQHVDGITTSGNVKLKVLGFHNDGAIVEVRDDFLMGEVEYRKGEVFVADQFNLIETDPKDGWYDWEDKRSGLPLRPTDGVSCTGMDDGRFLEVTFYKGDSDAKPVIQIDGEGDFRININDSTIYNESTDTVPRMSLAALAYYKQQAGLPAEYHIALGELRDELTDAGYTLPELEGAEQ